MARVSKFLLWSPRILGLLFVAFLMLFSLDVFDAATSFWQIMLGLFMHNIPAFALLAAVIISWKHEWVGAIVFYLAGIAYIIVVTSRVPSWTLGLLWLLSIALPAFAVALLFLLNWKKQREY